MSFPRVKSAELFRKYSESDNGWTDSYAESKACGIRNAEAGDSTPDSTLSRVLAQVPSGTNRGWPSLIDRFWASVQKTPTCWLWTGTTCNGYGQIAVCPAGRQVRFRAHRLSWLLHFGDLPDGLEVMHSCDEPRCCRPAHLQLGTHKENMADAAKKGRMRGRHVPPEHRLSPLRGAQGGSVRPRKPARPFQVPVASGAAPARRLPPLPSTAAGAQG